MFGLDGETVIYFRSIPEMVDRARWLLENDAHRKRLAAAAYARITRACNTYADRLEAMLETAGLKAATSQGK
jgi:spore maturation protein CgeB